MTTLEERFVAAIDDLALPSVDLVDSVLESIPESARSPRPQSRTSSRRLLVGAAAALVALASMFAITPVREAVADWFGIGATQIVADAPDDPTVDPAGLSASTAQAIGGVPVEVDLNPLPSLEAPMLTLDHPMVGGRSFLWSPGPDLGEMGDTNVAVSLYVRPVDGPTETKFVGQGVGIEPVSMTVAERNVNGLWLDGIHVSLRGGEDRPVLADRVLLWTIDGLQYRLEADLGLEDIVTLAESVQGGTDLLPAG